jgi:hypothetical protein
MSGTIMARKNKRKRKGKRRREQLRSPEENITVSKEKLVREWISCPRCAERVKTKNLSRHARDIHGCDVDVRRETSFARANHSSKVLVVASIAIILVAVMWMYNPFSESDEDEGDDVVTESGPSDGGDDTNGGSPPQKPDSNPDNPPQDDDPKHDSEEDWLDSYSPVYSTGSGDDDWWITYPEQHPSPGTDVEHLDWILDSLDRKPLVILAHSEGCIACQQQQEDMDELLEEHGEEVKYYDIMLDGTDPRGSDLYEVYDPNKAQQYMPLTIIVTLVKDGGGGVKVAWHSQEGATGEDWLWNYTEDAICYHTNNVDNRNR